MKTIIAELPEEYNEIELHLFSDWHIGDKQSNLKAIRNEIEIVRSRKNAYCVLMGDLCNNATKTSISDCYSEEYNPMEQVELLTNLLDPIKDKIIFSCQGNHEARTFRNDGIDICAIVANNLGVLDKYAREGGALFIKYGTNHRSNDKRKRKNAISAYIAHGCRGGRKEGAKAIQLADMASICDVDLYCVGHTHLPFIMKESFFRVDYANSTMRQVEKTFVNASAQLDGYGGYGQTALFKPSSIACPVIYITPNGVKALL